MPPDLSHLKLADALEKRLAIIADLSWRERDSAGHLAALGAVSQEIEVLAAVLPRPVPGELAHYLERRSLDKALAWIRA